MLTIVVVFLVVLHITLPFPSVPTLLLTFSLKFKLLMMFKLLVLTISWLRL
jgi:hypothetical protein